MDAREARNLAAIERLSLGFVRHDVDAILDCFAEDGIFDITEGPDPWGERFEGKAARTGSYYKAGATILGDGTVSFILDVRGLIELSRHGISVAA